MSEQSPGTYTGADGRAYRWAKGDGYYHTQADNHTRVRDIAPADWPAAKAALDALVEQEEGWVEIDEHARIKRDGTAAQWRHGNGYGQNWHPLSSDDKRWPAAYRKGREMALEEASALRDAVRELVRTIRDAGVHSCNSLLPSVDGWQRIKYAAKTLEGKL